MSFQSPSPSSQRSKVLRIGNFRLGKTIGVGSFGKVKLAEHVVTRHKVAVKILNRSKIRSLRMDVKITREIANLKLFRHPHIIKLYEVIETPSDIFMVMEYVPGGELFDYIVAHGKLSEGAARRFFQQIIAAIHYCHQHMVVHRDLKPENLLISSRDNSVKIADFGLSTMMSDGEFLKTSCGSPNYAAPEVISGKLYAGPEVDVWSCGVILYTLVCARLPFDDDYIPALFKKIRAGQYAIPAYVSQDCADLIRTMLVVDPLDRTTTAEIMNHRWFTVDLPPYLAPTAMPSSIEPDNMDEDIIQEIANSWQHAFRQGEGVSGDVSSARTPENLVSPEQVRQALVEAVETHTINEFVVAYNLISDAKDDLNHRKELDAIQAHQAAQAGSYPGTGSLPTNAEQYAMSPPMSLRDDSAANVAISYERNRAASGGVGLAAPLPRSEPQTLSGLLNNRGVALDAADREATNRNQWFLGLATSSEPLSVMTEVYRAVTAIGLEWKLTGPWALHARRKQALLDSASQHEGGMSDVGSSEQQEQSAEVEPEKLGLTLFKVKEGKFLLDIKLLQGDTFVFFDICSRLLGEIRL